MTSTDELDAAPEDAAAAPGSSPMLFGTGQAGWLTLVTLVAVAALALSIVALVLAADDDDGGGGGAAPPSGPVTELAVTTTEFAFDPASSTVVAGTDVAVEIENIGAVNHSWTVLAEPVTSEEEIADAEQLANVEVDVDEQGSTTVNLEPGTYQVVCTVTGHFSAGMEAEVVAE
jgi:plastocyanin